MTRYKTASAKAVEAPTTSTEGAVQQPGRIAHEEAQASGSNAAMRLNGERLQEEYAAGWKKSCGVTASTTPPVVTAAAATPKPFANGTKVLLASKRSGGSVTTDCDSSAADGALQKSCWGASEGGNSSTASGTRVSNILNESLEKKTQNKHSPAFSTATATAEQTIPVTRGRSAAVKIDSKASRPGAVSTSAARIPSTQTRARSLNAKLRARTPASSLAAVVGNTEVGRRPKHSPSVPDRIIIRSCQRGTVSDQATSTNGESAGGIMDETSGLVSAAPAVAVASAEATSRQGTVSTRAASSTGARITRVVLANGGDAASDPSVANERGRRAGGSGRDDSRSRGRSSGRGNRGTSGGRKGGKGGRRGGGRGGGGGKEGGEDDEQDEDEDGEDGAEIDEDALGGGAEIESLEDVQSRLHQANVLSAKIDTAMLRVGDREKGTTATDESRVGATEASAPASAANIPPARDIECRRRRVPTARLQQHLVEVQRNSRARSAKKSESKSQGGTQQHQHQAGAKAVATAVDSNACGSRGGAVETDSSPPATVAGRGSRVGGGRMSSRKRRRSEAAVTSASGASDVGTPAADVGNTHASVAEVAAAREVAVATAAESVVAEPAATVATPVIPLPPAPSADEEQMRAPAGEATVVAPPSITDAATTEVRVAKDKDAESKTAEARAEGLRAADAKIAEAKAAAAKARADEAAAAAATYDASKADTQAEAVAPPTTAEITARAEAGVGVVAADEGIPPPLDTKVINDVNSSALTSSTSGATAPPSSPPIGEAVTTFWDTGAGRQQGHVQEQQKHQQEPQQQQKKQQQKPQQKRREAVVTPVNGTTRTHHTRSCGGSARARAESSERTAREEAAAAAAAEAAEKAAKERAQRREEARVAAEARAAALEAMKWEECVDESEAFVTAMLASVVRSLAEGPKTETELDQSVRSDMDAGRAAAGLPVADWSESHMVNVRLVVDVLIALGLVRSEYNTAEQASGWPMDVHPPSKAHGGAPAPCFCSSVMRRAVARHTKMSASSLPDAQLPIQPLLAGDPFQLGIPWNPAAAPDGGGTDGGEASFQPPVGNAAVYGVPGQVLATVPGAMTAAMSSDIPAEAGVAWVYTGVGMGGASVDTGQGLPAKGEIGVDGIAAGVVANAANTEVQSIPTVKQVAAGEAEPVTVEVNQAAVQSAHVPTAQAKGYLPAQHGGVNSMLPSERTAPQQQQEQCPPESTLPRLPGFRSNSAEASGGSPGEIMPAAAVGDAGGGSGAASQALSVVSAEHSETVAGEAASSYGSSGGAPSSSLSTSDVDATAAALSMAAPPPSSSPLGDEALSAKTAAMPVSSISGGQKAVLQSATVEAGNGGFTETSASGTMPQWGANSALSPHLTMTNNSATPVVTEGGGNDGAGRLGGMNASLSSRAPSCSAAEADITVNPSEASIADGQTSTHQAPAGSSTPRVNIPDTPPPKRVGVTEALMLTRMSFEGVFSPTEERRKLALYNVNNNDGGSNSGDPYAAAATVAGAVDDDGGSSSEAINVAAMELEALDSPPPSGSCKSITTAVGADVALTWGGVSGVEGIGGTDTDCRDAKASLYARFLRDPAGVVVPNPENSASATATPVTAAVAAATAMAASAQGDVTDVSPETPLEVVALGEELSDEAKALAEEGLFDLVSEAWGDQTTELAHAYMEYALPHLPIDAHAFELAVEGKLQPGGEVEDIYGKPAVEVLNLWLYLKSESWVKWRDAQIRGVSAGNNATGSNVGANGRGGGISTTSVPSSYSVPRNDYFSSSNSGGGGLCGVPKVFNAGGVFSAGSERKSPGGRNSGRRSATGKSSGRARGREGRGGAASASSRVIRQRHVRYRLEGDQDRYLVDWEEPARRALKLEMEAARLALCEEAVLRDILRRCGISLPPGYARAGAIDKLRGRSSSRRNSNGQTVGVRAQGRGGASAVAAASAATAAVTADTRLLQYTAQASVPEWSMSRAGGAVAGSAGKISRGGSLEGVSDKAGRPRAKGKAGKGGLRRQSSVGRPRTKSSKRRKVDGSLEDYAASDNDRGSLSDSSLSSYRHYRSRSSPGHWDHYSTGENGISSDATVPPSLRGFTPGLTAAEAIRLAKQRASANAAASSSSSFQQQQSRTSALNIEGSFHTNDGGVRKGGGGLGTGDTGGGNSGCGGGITRENSGNSRSNGGRRRSDWTMLTPHIRCPLPLLRGTRGPWRSSTGGVGSGGGVGGWNGHGGGNGGLDSSGCGGSGNGGGGSSMREGESFIFSPSSSTSSARRRKGGTGPCGVGGSYEDGDVGFGEGKNGEGSGDISIRERAVSQAELFMRAMPKAIQWSDVARQFAPINDAGGAHPPPSPVGSRDISRASSFPGSSSSLSSSTTTAAAAAAAAASVVSGDTSRPSAVTDTSGLVSSTPICSTSGLTTAAVATTEVAASSTTSGSSPSAKQLRISVPPNNNGVSMGSDAGGDVGSGGGREIKLEKMSSQASGGTVEIIAPTFWLVGTRDEGAGSTVELDDGNGETSGEDTSDEAFERRHTEHLAWMKEKIEAARRARELASPRPPPKKRAGSFSGGRGTSKSGNLSGAAAAATGGTGGGVPGGGGGVTWSQAGGSVKGNMSRKNSGGRRSRCSDSNSQRSRNRRGASGSPRASLTAQQAQLSEAPVDASSRPATSLPDAAAVATMAEATEPSSPVSTAVETTNPSAPVGVLASVAEANSAPNSGAASVAADGDGGRGLAEGAGGEAIAPSVSSAVRELGVARENDKVTAPLDVSTSGSVDSGGGTDGVTAVAPSVVAAGQDDSSAAGAATPPDLLQPTPSRLPSLSPPTK